MGHCQVSCSWYADKSVSVGLIMAVPSCFALAIVRPCLGSGAGSSAALLPAVVK